MKPVTDNHGRLTCLRRLCLGYQLFLGIGFSQGVQPGPSLSDFVDQYPLPPVQDYTFLGTERSEEKPIVTFTGQIELWFNPADHVSWLRKAIATKCFQVELMDGYLPALNYSYQDPDSDRTCVMTAFAVDAEAPGAIHLYVSLAETETGKTRTRYFRLRDLASIGEAEFNLALRELRAHWAAFFARGKTMRCADPMLLNAAKASMVRALITFRGKHPHYGVRAYGESIHDGFPPTIIALVDCLLDWEQPEAARDYLAYYFGRFVTTTGRFDYYGASLAEYGQMLRLVRRLYDATTNHLWFEAVRPKVERMAEWLWLAVSNSATGLIPGVPEADTRDQVDTYFHNNAWVWRGLRDIAPVSCRNDTERCERFREQILQAINGVTDRDPEPPFIPPVARKLRLWTSMTQDDFASYTNYRYWLELLSSGALPHAEASAIIRYRQTHAGEFAGLTRFRQHADNWPIAEYGFARLAWGEMDAVRELLLSHFAGHMTRATWTAYEQVSLATNSPRRAVADYCVPVQLAGARLLAAWLAAACPDAQARVPAASESMTVDGWLNESFYQRCTPIELNRVAGSPGQQPPRTRAWLQWQPERLFFAFEVKDTNLVAQPPSTDEHAVDTQDRVEVFLWSGREQDAYGCIEIGACGAVHDYLARFYRQMNDVWQPIELKRAVRLIDNGYCVEGAIARADLEALKLRLAPGARWRVGLFRAEFTAAQPNAPTWITWVDAQGPHPDFHVPGSFGEVELAPTGE